MQSPELDGLKISSRVTLLEPGMYIFRYASQPPADKPVCIALQQAPLGKGSIDFFPAEGVSKNMLTRLGDTIVARVKGGITTVLITEYHMFDAVIDPIDLRIDRIDTSTAIMRNFTIAATAEPSAAISSTLTPVALKLVAHLQGEGDVMSTEGWTGEPDGTGALKGFPSCGTTSRQAWTGFTPPLSPAPALALMSLREPSPVPVASLCLWFQQVSAWSDPIGILRIVWPPCLSRRCAAGHCRQPDDVRPHRHRALVALHICIAPATKMNAARYKSPWENSALTQKISSTGQMA